MATFENKNVEVLYDFFRGIFEIIKKKNQFTTGARTAKLQKKG